MKFEKLLTLLCLVELQGLYFTRHALFQVKGVFRERKAISKGNKGKGLKGINFKSFKEKLTLTSDTRTFVNFCNYTSSQPIIREKKLSKFEKYQM